MTLAQIIREHQDRILELWSDERVLSARGLTRSEVELCLPELLAVLGGSYGGARRGGRRGPVERYFSTRLRHGYDLAEMVEELASLGRCIATSWNGGPPERQPSAGEVAQLFSELAWMTAVVIEMFTRHMLEDEQADKRHVRALELAARRALESDSGGNTPVDKLVELAMDAMGADAASLWFSVLDGGRAEKGAAIGMPEAGCQALAAGATTLAEGQARVLPTSPVLERAGLKTLLAVRLRASDGRTALLCVGFSEHRRCAAREIRRLELLGDRLTLHLESAQLYARLKQTIRALEVEREERTRFVSLLAHDLLGPLSAAKMKLDLLSSTIDGSGGQLVRRTQSSIERASRMIRDMLDATRIHAGKRLPLQLRPCELSAVIQQAADELAAVHGPRFQIDACPPLRGTWDPDELARALWNLGTNAAKYGAADQPITISARPQARRIRLSVHNWGQVIPDDELARLFEPFTRSRRADGARKGGWGLGLTLVRGCAEAHGGSVSVESTPEHGTTFSLELPVGPSISVPSLHGAIAPSGPSEDPELRARA
jgi:signal transduction histidine kinase